MKTSVNIIKESSLTLPDGRVIEPGQEITILDPISEQKRRYRLRRVEANGDITCWGHIEASGLTPNGSMRTFKRECLVNVKHRKSRSRSINEQEEN